MLQDGVMPIARNKLFQISLSTAVNIRTNFNKKVETYAFQLECIQYPTRDNHIDLIYMDKFPNSSLVR